MVGWFYWIEGQPQVEVISLLGVPILKVGWPMPRRTREKNWKKQMAKGVAFLKSRGCRRVLYGSSLPYGDWLIPMGLRPMAVAPLCRRMADRLALAHLAGQGIAPTRATVCLLGERVDDAMCQTAYALCPKVRTLMIEAYHGGQQLSKDLQETFGMAILKVGTPHLTLIFSAKEEGIEQKGRISLWEKAIYLDGYELFLQGLPLLEGLESLPLLCLLWEQKKISLNEIEIIPTTLNRIPLDITR